jgi:hypothetical protein
MTKEENPKRYDLEERAVLVQEATELTNIFGGQSCGTANDVLSF